MPNRTEARPAKAVRMTATGRLPLLRLFSTPLIDLELRSLIAGRRRIKSMTKKAVSPGAVHSVPADLQKILISDAAALAKWEDITPLARNEWICWVISVKKLETRKQHIERVRTELKEGMRRPCCWPGCPHR